MLGERRDLKLDEDRRTECYEYTKDLMLLMENEILDNNDKKRIHAIYDDLILLSCVVGYTNVSLRESRSYQLNNLCSEFIEEIRKNKTDFENLLYSYIIKSIKLLIRKEKDIIRVPKPTKDETGCDGNSIIRNTFVESKDFFDKNFNLKRVFYPSAFFDCFFTPSLVDLNINSGSIKPLKIETIINEGKISIVQLPFNDYFKFKDSKCNFTRKDKDKIIQSVSKAKEEKLTKSILDLILVEYDKGYRILIFPECLISKSVLEKMKNLMSKHKLDMIIFAGSYHSSDCQNIATILGPKGIVLTEQYKWTKAMQGVPKNGALFFNILREGILPRGSPEMKIVKAGETKFGVVVCADFFRNALFQETLNLDFVVLISFADGFKMYNRVIEKLKGINLDDVKLRNLVFCNYKGDIKFRKKKMTGGKSSCIKLEKDKTISSYNKKQTMRDIDIIRIN